MLACNRGGQLTSNNTASTHVRRLKPHPLQKHINPINPDVLLEELVTGHASVSEMPFLWMESFHFRPTK